MKENMICIVQYSTVQYSTVQFSTADRIEEAIDRMVSALGKIEFPVTHIVLALTNIPEKRNSVFKYPILSYPILSYPILAYYTLFYSIVYILMYSILSYHHINLSILSYSIQLDSIIICPIQF